MINITKISLLSILAWSLIPGTGLAQNETSNSQLYANQKEYVPFNYISGIMKDIDALPISDSLIIWDMDSAIVVTSLKDGLLARVAKYLKSDSSKLEQYFYFIGRDKVLTIEREIPSENLTIDNESKDLTEYYAVWKNDTISIMYDNTCNSPIPSNLYGMNTERLRQEYAMLVRYLSAFSRDEFKE